MSSARIQLLMIAQQQELRRMIRPLKGDDLGPPVGRDEIVARLREVTGRIERQWGQPVELTIDDWERALPAGMAQQIDQPSGSRVEMILPVPGSGD